MGIYKAANRGRHSLVELEGCKQFIEVPVRRLDDLVKDAAVESWDLVKMDVEGYEAFVFEGAKDTLAHAKMLVMEYAPIRWRKAGIDPEAVFRKLSTHFSRVRRFAGLELVKAPVEELVRMEGTWDLLLER